MIRKAFTLVELLIVIVVIGVLAMMMMLSSTEAVTSAKAAKIIADLTNLRTALTSWYIDNIDRIRFQGDKFYFDNVQYNSIQDAIVGKTTENFRQSGKHVDNGLSISKYLNGLNNDNGQARNGVGVSESGEDAWLYLSEGGYGVNDAGKNQKRSTWFVGYRFYANDNAVKEKLKSRAASLGLIFFTNRPNHKPYLDGTKQWNGGNITQARTVWIRALGDHPIDNSD